MQNESMDGHHDAVESDNQHTSKEFEGEIWDFLHLQPFRLTKNVLLNGCGIVVVDVIVLFSNHCYTRKIDKNDEFINNCHIVMDGKESRVMDAKRYQLSRKHLPNLIKSLDKQKIRPSRENFFIVQLENEDPDKSDMKYVVFFDLKKDSRRKNRLLLRVKSAYVLERELSKREQQEKRIKFDTLLKQALNN